MRPPRTRPKAGPTLTPGERLGQAEFHRRYEAHPDATKFELIGGVVHMASPMRSPHGLSSFELALALGLYKAATPGVEGAEGITAVLGEGSEPMPDLLLRLLPECGGTSRIDERQYLVGPPEFVVEVAHATLALDLSQKKDDYLAAGVQEYLVVDVEDRRLHWFHFPSKRRLRADKAGLWRSRALPGLWLDAPALFGRDSNRLIDAVRRGTGSPEHAAFVRLLAARRPVAPPAD